MLPLVELKFLALLTDKSGNNYDQLFMERGLPLEGLVGVPKERLKMRDDVGKIYPLPNGERGTAQEFAEQTDSMFNPYIQPGKEEYNKEFGEFVLKHGSHKLKKQIAEQAQGLRVTLSPARLIELSKLGKRFDKIREAN